MASVNLVPEEAPPPYTPTDPLTPSSSSNNNVSIIDGDASLSRPFSGDIPSYSHIFTPPNFISATRYFNERSPPASYHPDREDEPFEHVLTIYKKSQAKDYSRFPRCWRHISEDITQHDWDTFLSYLLPPHLGFAASHPHLPRQLRAEIERDRKDRLQETVEERRTRLVAVVGEWNTYFFRPRGVTIACHNGHDNGTTPLSPLCPNCYPNAVTSLSSQRTLSSSPSITVGQRRSQTRPDAPSSSSARQQLGAEQVYLSSTETSGEYVPGGTQNAQNLSRSWTYGPTTTIQNLAQNLATQISEQAQQYGQVMGEQAQNVGRTVEANMQMHADYIQQQVKRAERVGEATCRSYGVCGRDISCSRRGNRWQPNGQHCPYKGVLGTFCRRQFDYNSNYKNSQNSGSQERSASASDLSSLPSSVSSSMIHGAFTSSVSSDLHIGTAAVAMLRDKINILKERRLQGSNTPVDYSSVSSDIRDELRALKTKHQERHHSTTYTRDRASRHSIYQESQAADALAIKQEMQKLKQEYRELMHCFSEEKQEIRRAKKEHKREARGNRKEEKKARKEENKRAKKKDVDDPTLPHTNRSSVVHTDIDSSSAPPPPFEPSSTPSSPNLISPSVSELGPLAIRLATETEVGNVHQHEDGKNAENNILSAKFQEDKHNLPEKKEEEEDMYERKEATQVSPILESSSPRTALELEDLSISFEMHSLDDSSRRDGVVPIIRSPEENDDSATAWRSSHKIPISN